MNAPTVIEAPPPRILTLFLSAGKSLRWWRDEGLFSREILIYRRLLEMGEFDIVQIFSYDAADREFIAGLAESDPIFRRVHILAPPRGRGGKTWGVKGVLAHRAAIAKSAAIKTNQISGAWAATIAAQLTGVPMMLRAGYVQSRNLRLAGKRSKAVAAAMVERIGSRVARRIVVTSELAAGYFRDDLKAGSKVLLLPTYVDVDAFAMKDNYDWTAPIVTVGRFSQPKNLPNLLQACALAGVGITLVGAGEKEAELRSLAASLPIPVHFAGKVDNADLPDLLARHAIFAIPSFYEGLPKALIEAMSVGLVPVGSNIPGVADLIEHGVTGYLTEGTEPEQIAAGIRRALTSKDASVGAKAREKIQQQFGLARYAASEAAIFREIIAHKLGVPVTLERIGG